MLRFLRIVQFSSTSSLARINCLQVYHTQIQFRKYCTMDRTHKKPLVIAHFNDVYRITEQTSEPVGGASRFFTQLKQLMDYDPLVLFSGDCFSPSLMSNATKGEQMPPVLNLCKVSAACVGNHDLDFGIDHLESLIEQCNFPWFMSNVKDKATGDLVANLQSHMVIEHSGWRVGIVGLVEQEWLETLSSTPPECLEYTDFVTHARDVIDTHLAPQKPDVIIAITHMRYPNDVRLAQNVPQIDLVLGGHDHGYVVQRIPQKQSSTEASVVVKSGSDFRDLTGLVFTWNDDIGLSVTGTNGMHEHVNTMEALTSLPDDETDNSGNGNGNNINNGNGNGSVPDASLARDHMSANGVQIVQPCEERARVISAVGKSGDGVGQLLQQDDQWQCVQTSKYSLLWRHYVVDGTVPPDPEMQEVVAMYEEQSVNQFQNVIGYTSTQLDGRFATIRSSESTLGNMICDVLRQASGCDAVLINSGTLRSDQIHDIGPIKTSDVLSILPYEDDCVVVQVTGQQLHNCLENGVSQYPKLEGRFPQVSGILFSFDPSREPGDRVPQDTVVVGGAPLDLNRNYSLCTKVYLAEGRDGYADLADAPRLRDPEASPQLPLALRQHLLQLEVLTHFESAIEDTPLTHDKPQCNNVSNGTKTLLRRFARRVRRDLTTHRGQNSLLDQVDSPMATDSKKIPIPGLAKFDVSNGRYVLAPELEGRISVIT